MAEHWPENMIGETVSAWCKVCHRNTPHRIDRVAVGSHAGKLGPCLRTHAQQMTKAQRRRQDVIARDAERSLLTWRP